MSYIIFILSFFTSILLSLEINNLESNYLSKNVDQSINNSLNKNNVIPSNIIHNTINPNEYIVGPGDIFTFNMTIPNRIINIELIVSPTSEILIPGIGIINISGNNLKQTYNQIINECLKIHEDAYVYINISKLRNFKILITGDSMYAGMHIVTSSYRVSDLVEKIYIPNSFDSVLVKIFPDYSPNIMLDKDLFIERKDSIINVDLFSYFFEGKFDDNPILLEGDKLIIKNSNSSTILGEINNPSRFNDIQNITYNDLVNLSGGFTENAERKNILILNKSFFNSQNIINKKNTINLEDKYRSDLDESYLKSRSEMLQGLIKINESSDLDKFLNRKVSNNDIVIIPSKIDFIEIIGGVNNPGAYKYEDEKYLYEYILMAGGLSENAKKNNYFLIDMINGTKTKVSSNYKIKRGDVIFVEYNIGYKEWDRFKDIVDLIGRISTTLLVIFNIWSATNG